MRKAVLIAMVLSSGLFAVLSQRAEAGWHHAAKSYAYGCGCYLIPGCVNEPGFWACGYPSSSNGCGRHCSRSRSYTHAGCAARYCGTGYCGYGSCGAGSCGYSSCGGGSCGWSSCGGGGCGWGCTSPGCSGGSCSTSGQSTGGEEVIYDGPAANAPPAPVSQPEEAQYSHNAPYRLVSNKQADGSAAFDKGVSAFRAHSLNDAAGAFDMAVAAEPDNAFFWYYRAMTLFDLGNTGAANEALQKAIALEREEPIANWGRRMERVQGRNRNWVENARRAAGLVR